MSCKRVSSRLSKMLGVTIGLLLCASGIAQSIMVDSLRVVLETTRTDTQRVAVLNELCWELAGADPEAALDYGAEALELSRSKGFMDGEATAHAYLGRTHKVMGQFPIAIEHLSKALALEKGLGDVRGQAINHNELGNTYKHMADYPSSLHHFQEASRFFEQSGEEQSLASVKLNKAYLHQFLEEYREAIGLCSEVLAIQTRSGNAKGAGRACICLGISYVNLEQLDTALLHYERALAIFKPMNDPTLMPAVLNNIGVVYGMLGQFSKAIVVTERSIAISDSLGHTNNVAIGYSDLGDVHMDAGEPELAIESFNKSLALAKETGSAWVSMNVLERKSKALQVLGKFELAFNTRLEYEALKDSIHSTENEEQLLQLREGFEAEKREEEIARLKLEKEAAEAQADLRSFLLGSVIVLLILLVASGFLYMIHRKSKENERLAVLEQKALRSQMNPHFIFNSLNSIQRLYVEGDLDKANDHVADFAKLLRMILENSGRSTISLADELEALDLYLELEKMRANGQIECVLSVEESIDQNNTMVPPLIIQPFVENAIWHGILPKDDNGKIEVELKMAGDMLICTISDNGIGIEESRKNKTASHESKAMRITAERLGAANAIKAEQLAKGGTRITMKIPLGQ